MIIQEKKPEPTKYKTNPASIGEMIEDFKKRGYQLMFIREATSLYCIEMNQWITPENFSVDECYHFEDASNPDRDRMLYAISPTQIPKGFLIDESFVYQDNISPEMVQKLKFEYSAAVEL